MSDDLAPTQLWSVPEESSGERLDRGLAERLDLPRNQIQKWIRDAAVKVNGRKAKASTTLEAGDRVSYSMPDPADGERIQGEKGELPLLYEDEALLVVDKPVGVAVHPGAGRSTGTLAHRLLGRYPELAGIGGPGRPGIVHRLDLDTSGVMVVARTAKAYQSLSEAFAERRVMKRYLALVYGSPQPPEGEIAVPIGRHPTHRKQMAVRSDGRPALTHYRRLQTADGASLLLVGIATGRTHQIRVHLKNLGHPLIGDPLYGEARWKARPRTRQRRLREFPRPALHAWRLAFDHPVDGRRMRFEAPVPEDFRSLWRWLGGEEIVSRPPDD